MVAHEVYALISGRDVMNIVVGDYYNCNEAAKTEYGASSFAVEITQYPVQIGDEYLNGVFSRLVDGEYIRIDPYPTESEEIIRLSDALNDVELALVELYEGGL
jgi:hypothetical protein